MTEPTTPPPLTLDIEEFGDTALVTCHGRLLSSTSDFLYQPVSKLILTHKHVVLDLSDLTGMDSMGLGSLVRLFVSATGKGHTLQLRNLGKKVRDLLILTNLLNIFTVSGEHGVGIH